MQIVRPRLGFSAIITTVAAMCISTVCAQPLPPKSIKPTVTADAGDPGGKFFGREPEPARTRHYYIAAESVIWDYAPLGLDPICGIPFPPAVQASHASRKVRYFQYTDANFNVRVPDAPRLGILGPVMRGVVGDYLAVTFLNRTAQPLSMHPHGVKYDKDSEGSYYRDNATGNYQPGRGAAVGSQARFTYIWHLDKASGPLPGEPSSKAWLYHSHVAGDSDANLGAMGFIIVTDPKRARPDGTPNDVDREMAALFMIFDESQVDEEERERLAALNGTSPVHTATANSWSQFKEMAEQGARHSINGLLFGNLPGLEMKEGEHVRWYLFGLGSEEDFHTAHFHGLRMIENGQRGTDTVELLPGSMKVADMDADNSGPWLLHCHVAGHMAEGMFARVMVRPRIGNDESGNLRDAFFGLPLPSLGAAVENGQRP